MKRFVLLLTVCFALFLSPVRAQTPIVLQVSGTALDITGPLFYAQELGFFKNAGLDVHIQSFSNVQQAAEAILAGSLDIGSANNATMAQAHTRGIDFRYFAPGALFEAKVPPTEVIAVAKDSTIRTAADLNGKTVGVAGILSMLQVATVSWAYKHGGNGKSVRFVEIPFSQMNAALSQHRVDAIVLTEPFATAASADTRVIGSPEDGVASRFMTLGWFATSTWLQAHADAAARFASAIREANAWGNTHHKESAIILSHYSKMPLEVVNAMSRSEYGLSLDAKLIQPAIDVSARYGIIDHAFPASELIWLPAAQK